MRGRWSRTAAATLALGVACAMLPVLEDTKGQQALPSVVAANALRPVTAFAVIADDRARAIALFQEAGKVIAHPRCMNCHPAGDSPTQTERMQPHLPLVVRGADGHGAPGMMCATCHHAANYDIPGCPDTRIGISRRSRWDGRGARCRRSVSRSRIARATAAATWLPWFSIWPRIRSSAGRGRRRRPRARAGYAGGVRRAGAGLGRRRRRLPAAVRPRCKLERDSMIAFQPRSNPAASCPDTGRSSGPTNRSRSPPAARH